MVAAHRAWLQATVSVREGSNMSKQSQFISATRSSEHIRSVAEGWLRVRIPKQIRQEWYRLAQSFVNLMCQVLEPRRPRGAVLRFRDLGNQGLSITWVISAPYGIADEELTLKSAARHYVELSRLLRLQCLAQAAGVWSMVTDVATERTELVRSQSVLDLAPQACVEGQADRLMAVFEWSKDVELDGGKERGRDGDTAVRVRETLKRLISSGRARPVRQPSEGWRQRVDGLEQKFPNFAAVVQTVVRPHLTLCELGVPHRMAPILLVGPPGVGKTYFAQQVAEIMGFQAPLFVHMAAETNGSALAGSSTFWSNSSPGALFEALAWGGVTGPAAANPLVVLDEIDKVNIERYNPLGALYSLLEVETARRFQDQSLPDVWMDASRARFIATANDEDAIPEPIRSRMRVFDIAPPTAHQLRGLVQGIFEGLLDALGVRLHRLLPPDVVDAALAFSPRELKLRLECSIACAISRGSDAVESSDWLPHGAAPGAATRRRIGF
jgi:ATPase family associated with various cellular activities (AAA)